MTAPPWGCFSGGDIPRLASNMNMGCYIQYTGTQIMTTGVVTNTIMNNVRYDPSGDSGVGGFDHWTAPQGQWIGISGKGEVLTAAAGFVRIQLNTNIWGLIAESSHYAPGAATVYLGVSYNSFAISGERFWVSFLQTTGVNATQQALATFMCDVTSFR